MATKIQEKGLPYIVSVCEQSNLSEKQFAKINE